MKKYYTLTFLLSLLSIMAWGQQVIGTFPAMDGGFESANLIDNSTTYSAAQTNKWVKNNTSSTIGEESSTVRSGAKSMSITNNSTTGRRVWSPLVTAESTTSNVTIQFYRRVENTTNTQESQAGVGNGTTTGEALSGSYATPSSANTWEKVTYTRSSWTYTNIAGAILTRQKGTGGTLYIDDFVMYNGSVDNSAPNSPGAVLVDGSTPTSLTVSWSAAAGGIDGGGYVVVRYSTSPNADNDPNQNGIYAVGNTINNGTGALSGTVRYIGTGTSFTDNVGLSSGTQYWYKVYTVDKAFNYSAESQGSGTTTGGSPIIDVSPTTLTGFSYTVGSGPSAEQSFTVSGTNLTADISIQPPTNYEISTGSGASFSATNPINLAHTGGTVDQTVIYVRLKAGLGAGAYSSETINLTSTGADPKTVTCSGDVWPQIEWANLQWPTSGNIVQGDDFTVYAQVYKGGVTDAAGQGAGIQAWIGYSASNTNPNTWTDWVLASYNSDVDNNDEYTANIGAVIPSTGTYYYASRFKLGNADYVYGGTDGFWNGTGNNSGTLTVTAAPQLTWVNLHWPGSGTITTGGEFFVYAQAFKDGLTPGPGAGAGITAWIGYSTDDTDPSDWENWHVASYFGESGNNDEYRLDLGSVIPTTGTYYYASRFKLGAAPYVYGGFSGGFWDGTTNVSGILTIQLPEPSNHATGFSASYTPPTTTSITLNWTDAVPAAESYLIKGSTTGFGAIVAPVDGTAETNGTLVRNVAAGVQAHTFTGLTPSTAYYFKIWPYNGTGAQINYKTDGSVPEASGVTEALSSLLLNENFVYTVGTKLTENGYSAHSSGGTNAITVQTGSITYPGYLSTDVGNEITLTTSGEDVNRTFPAQNSGVVYASFLVNVSSASTTGDYFFHLGQTTIGTTFRGRVFVKRDASNNIAFGVAQSTATANYTDLIYALNTTYLIVLKYDIVDGTANDVASIIINPILNSLIPSTGWITNTDAAGTDMTEVGSVAIRQGGATTAPVLKLDGIRVSNIWADIVGQPLTFTGTGNWSDTPRWTAGILPSINSAATIDGSAAVSTAVNVNLLQINNANSLTISNTGQLTVTGTLTNNAGNNGLVIKSDATGTGSLLHNSNNVPATVERFITGNAILQNTYDYHLVSVPLNAAVTAAQFLGSYLYRFDVASQNWAGLGTSLTTPLPNDQGYMIFYPNTSTTYSFTGQLNNGSFTAATPITAADHFALVPNPYPSAIDWDAASGWTKTNIRNAIWIWNPVTDQYAAYGAEAGVNGATRYIPAGQAFFVKSNAASPVLSMNNNVRVHNSQAFFKSGEQMPDLLRIHALGNSRTDEIVLRLRQGSNLDLDAFDVDKLMGAAIAPQLYTTTPDGRELAINSIAAEDVPASIPMGFSMQASGQVSLNFEGIDTFAPSLSIMLEDLLTGNTINLRENPAYSFEHSIANPAARFMLHLTSITALRDDGLSAARIWHDGRDICVALPDDDNRPLTIEVFDPLGRMLASYRENSRQFMRLQAPATGLMLVRISSEKASYSSKVFIR